MKVKDIMTRGVVAVGLDDSVGHLQELFKSHRFHHLLVKSGETLLGVISDRDLLKNTSPFLGDAFSELPRDRARLNRRAHQIMTRKLVATTEEVTVEEAARLMLDHTVSCLPVIDDRQHPIGIVTRKDILKGLVACLVKS